MQTSDNRPRFYTHVFQVGGAQGQAYGVGLNFAGMVLADAKYSADRGEKQYFNSPFKRRNFVDRARRFCGKFGIGGYADIHYGVGDGFWSGDVSSFGGGGGSYRLQFPMVKDASDPRSIMRRGYRCECEGSKFSGVKADWLVDKHMKILGNQLADARLSGTFGLFGSSSEAFRLTADVIDRIGRDDDYDALWNYELDERYARRMFELGRIVEKNFWKNAVA